MASYFVVDIQEITDPELYAEYRKGVSATLELYGGKFLVRGGAYTTVEGDWQPERFVIIEFEDVEKFKRWYNSPEYSALKTQRFQASSGRAIVIEGL